MAIKPINIDLRDLVADLNLNPQQAENMAETAVKAIALELKRQWDAQASKTLHATRNGYRAGIILVDKGKTMGEVVLTGKLNNMLEAGFPAYDMKPGLLMGRSSKQGKNGGRYATVPFRYAGAGAVGESGAFAGVTPPEVQKILQRNKGKPVTKTQLPPGQNKPKIRPAFSDTQTKQTYAAYTHKAPIMEGARRQGAQVRTFRRVSDKSAAASWINPGRPPLNLAEKAIQATNVDRVVETTIELYLRQQGF